MTHDDWELLQACPGWAALRQYLRDHRDGVKEQWGSGQMPDLEMPKAAVRCEIEGHLAGLEWRDVATFYGLWTEQDEDKYQGHSS